MDGEQRAAELLDTLGRINSIPAVQTWRLIHAMHGETAVLKFLAAEGGEASPGDISKILGRTNSRIANTLSSLEEKQCIVRAHSSTDKRRVTVRITPHGRSVMQKRRQESLEILTQIMTALGDADAKEYIRINGRILEILNTARIYAYHENPEETDIKGIRRNKEEAKNG